MQFKLNFYALLPFLTLLQALIFSSLLIYRGATKERRSDYWLALVLMLSAISDVPYMLGWMGINYLWTTLTFYPWDGWDFALPPALYFFFLHLTNQNYRFRKRDWFHFLPYAIYFTLSVSFILYKHNAPVYSLNNDVKILIVKQLHKFIINIYKYNTLN